MNTSITEQALFRVASGIGILATFWGVLVIFGWVFDLAALKSILPNLSTMKVNTAICMVLLGMTLWLSVPSANNARRNYLAGFPAAIVSTTGLLTLLQYLFQLNLGIDEALIPDDPNTLTPETPGRMAIGTAVNFSLLGIASMLGSHKTTLRRVLVYVVLLLSLLALMGYAFGVESLYQIRIYTSMAVHTALFFLLLSLGFLLCKPDGGLVYTLTQNSAGGAAGRLLVVIMPVLLILLGVIRAIGENMGWFGSGFGIALMVAASIAIMGAIVSWTMGILDRIDTERSQALSDLEYEHKQLLASDIRFRSTVYSLPIAILIFTEEGKISLVNSATERLLGYQREELLGKQMETLMPARFREQHLHARAQVFHSHSPGSTGWSGELQGLTKKGVETPIELWLTLVKTQTRNQLLASILDLSDRKRAEEAIQEANRSLERQVRDRTRSLEEANLKLQETSRRLVRSNQDLEQFAYVASHDLQEPLRGITGCADLLAQKYHDQLDDQGRELIEHILSGTGRMRSLVQGLLTFAQLDSHASPKVDVDLNGVLESVLTALATMLEESGGKVSSDQLPVVKADPMQIQLILQNLISNSLKFRGDAPPLVHVACEEDEHSWTISVQDNGIGIDPYYFDRIFKFFQRLHDRKAYPGTGIGLAIAKRVVEEHGGELRVSSEEGKGSTFTFSLAKEPVDELIVEPIDNLS